MCWISIACFIKDNSINKCLKTKSLFRYKADLSLSGRPTSPKWNVCSSNDLFSHLFLVSPCIFIHCTVQGINFYCGGCCSVAKLYLTLWDTMDCSTPGFPVLHNLLEFTHVHRVGDAIQPPHPLSSPSPPALNLSQNQSFPMSWLFTSGGQSIRGSARIIYE